MKRNLFELESSDFNELIDSLILPEYLIFEKMHSQNSAWKYHIKSYAKNVSANEFMSECNDRNIFIWLYTKLKPNDLKNRVLVKTQCANIFSHLINDYRSLKAIETAQRFCDGKLGLKDLDKAQLFAKKAIYWASKDIDVIESHIHSIDPPGNKSFEYSGSELRLCKEEVDQLYLKTFCATLAFEAVDYQTLFANANLYLNYESSKIKNLISQMVDLCKYILPFEEINLDENLKVID